MPAGPWADHRALLNPLRNWAWVTTLPAINSHHQLLVPQDLEGRSVPSPPATKVVAHGVPQRDVPFLFERWWPEDLTQSLRPRCPRPPAPSRAQNKKIKMQILFGKILMGTPSRWRPVPDSRTAQVEESTLQIGVTYTILEYSLTALEERWWTWLVTKVGGSLPQPGASTRVTVSKLHNQADTFFCPLAAAYLLTWELTPLGNPSQ